MTRNLALKYGPRLSAVAAGALAPMFAFAALPAGVEEAVEAGIVNINLLGVLIFGVIVAIATWKWLRRGM